MGQNAAVVKANLRKQGIVPKKVRKEAQPLFSFGGGSKKVTTADITFFIRQMATMIKSGVPLVQAFDIVSDGVDNKGTKQLIGDVRDSVASGNSFASALKQHPDQFDDLTCNLVESGEEAGALEEMLDKVAIYKEKTESLRKKIKKAMMYPARSEEHTSELQSRPHLVCRLLLEKKKKKKKKTKKKKKQQKMKART